MNTTTDQPSGIPLIRALDVAVKLAHRQALARESHADAKQKRKAWRTYHWLCTLIEEEITAEAVRRGCLEGRAHDLMKARIDGEVWPDMELEDAWPMANIKEAKQFKQEIAIRRTS